MNIKTCDRIANEIIDKGFDELSNDDLNLVSNYCKTLLNCRLGIKGIKTPTKQTTEEKFNEIFKLLLKKAFDDIISECHPNDMKKKIKAYEDTLKEFKKNPDSYIDDITSDLGAYIE